MSPILTRVSSTRMPDFPRVRPRILRRCLLASLLFSGAVQVQAELPTVLSDNIYKGDGVIDLLIDVLPAELQSYLTGGKMYLGVDLNEAASGLESSSSVGVAIKDLTLSIQTTTGQFSFSDFYSNSTALILESGATAAAEFYTLFGTAGGNQITGGNQDFDLSAFDDVIYMEDILIDGDILSSSISVTFLDTQGSGNNENFFDYGAGFEQFAVLSDGDAALLDAAGFGLTESTKNSVSYVITEPTGTPEPYWFIVLLVPVCLMLKNRFGGHEL